MSTKDTAPGMSRAGVGDAGAPSHDEPRVLVVDDDDAVATSIARMLRGTARSVSIASDAEEALSQLASEEHDVVVSDIAMPRMNGMELLRAVRARDLDLPVILVTGAPSVDSAAEAVELGAFRYLQKPIDLDRMRRAVRDAARLRALAKTKGGSVAMEERASLEAAFRRAITSLTIVYQPIVEPISREAIGHEALMRPNEPPLTSPLAMLDAAEKLGALHLLGRRVRNLVACEIQRHSERRQFFVNVHAADLADRDLYDAAAPLSRCARQVVLEITERASLEAVPDLDDRFRQLRALGYQLAVDDLGAGYAGLSYFAQIRPELVKIDMSLVRGVDTDPVRQRVVLSLVGLAKGLGMEVVAEGVETTAERDVVVRLGCTYVQGYALARPGPPFPAVTWK